MPHAGRFSLEGLALSRNSEPSKLFSPLTFPLDELSKGKPVAEGSFGLSPGLPYTHREGAGFNKDCLCSSGFKMH